MAPITNLRSEDYYEVLGVSREATDAEMTKAYRKLALKHHPDKNQDRKEEAEEEFKRITEAYDVLREPEKRQVYDRLGKQGLDGSSSTCNARGFPGASGMTSEQAQTIFASLFGGSGFGRMPSGTRVFSSDGGVDFSNLFMSTGTREGRRGGHYHQEPCAMRPGQEVVVHGLAATSEHNGKVGQVQVFDERRCRYEVRFQDGHVVSVSSEKLTQLCGVEIHGLKNKPELNGQCANIIGFDAGSGRYIVRLQGTRTALRLQPHNCVLKLGTCVRLQGLRKAELNGQLARIADIDRKAGRYKLESQHGKQIKVKYENVLC